MARPLRIEFPGALYHITSRGNERKAIYRDDSDRQHFLALLAVIAEPFRVRVHAYVLMDNHYHLLAETLEANLARVMRQLNGDYAQHFNRRHHRVGHLFQARYKALLVDRDAYLVELGRYIHLNPVRAGMVGRAVDYAWSSAPAYVGTGAVPTFLTVAEVLGYFGRTARRAHPRYREFLRDAEEGRTYSAPLAHVVGQTLLGDPDWVRHMRHQLDAWVAAGHADGTGDREVPAVRRLRVRPTLDQVIDTVASAMRVERPVICGRHSRHRARTVAIYLARVVGGLPHRETAVAFGVGPYAISKAVATVRAELARNAVLRRLVNTLRTTLIGRLRAPRSLTRPVR